MLLGKHVVVDQVLYLKKTIHLWEFSLMLATDNFYILHLDFYWSLQRAPNQHILAI